MTMVYNRNYAQFETIFDFYCLPYHATKLARRQTTKQQNPKLANSGIP
jgi:hypothetical protein